MDGVRFIGGILPFGYPPKGISFIGRKVNSQGLFQGSSPKG